MALYLHSSSVLFDKLMVFGISCLLFIITTVHASELCPGTDNVYCDGYEEYCCGSSCCLNDWHYDYGFWNIWYFWFIIFFILMSCCGGCGFYRRRQVFLTQQQVDQLTQGPPPGGNTTVLGAGRLTYSSTTTGRSLVAHPMMYQGNAGPQGYFQGPPSYTEVTSKPELYPKAAASSNNTGPYPSTDPCYTPNATGLPYPVVPGGAPHQTSISPSYTAPGLPQTHTDHSGVYNNGVAPPPGIAPPPYTPYAPHKEEPPSGPQTS